MARRSSPSRADTRRAAGPSGRRASSSARRSCSSTPPASARSSSSAARGRSSGWRRTSPTSACTTTASTTSAPTATCGGWRARAASTRPSGSCSFYELALKVSGAVQARRWTPLPDGGFIHSFNGAHSLFVDTIRSLRALALAHRPRASAHRRSRTRRSACSTGWCSTRARPRVQRVLRRRAAIATTCADASRTKASSTSRTAPIAARARSRVTPPSSTWTRGLAWAMLGFAEQLEFLDTSRRRRSTVRRTRRDRSDDARGGARHLRLLHRERRGRRHSRTGIPARPAWQRLPSGATGRPIRSTSTSRSTAPPPRSPRRDCCGSRPSCPDAVTDARTVRAGRPARSRHVVRRHGPVPQYRSRATRDCCSTPSITGRMAGTTCPRARRRRVASRVSGGTITRARQPCM